MTSIETLSLWTFEDGNSIYKYGDIRQKVPGMMEVDYMVDCFYDPEGRLFLTVGSYSGDLGWMHLSLGNVEPMAILKGGHNETLRSVFWDSKRLCLLSGCEDGRLVQWI